MAAIRRVATIALTLAFGSVLAACSTHGSAQNSNVASTGLADGKEWTTSNLRVQTDKSYCYDDAKSNCDRYGRLYTWESAQRGCQSLGGGWRLPTNEDWRQMAKHYGGVRDDSADTGKAAYTALMIGGRSGFNAAMGGRRDWENGEYARLDAHAFYWTSTESGAATAWFYNLGKGGMMLNRHQDGDKRRALSARCVRD